MNGKLTASTKPLTRLDIACNLFLKMLAKWNRDGLSILLIKKEWWLFLTVLRSAAVTGRTFPAACRGRIQFDGVNISGGDNG
jgi:hypothetical protein